MFVLIAFSSSSHSFSFIFNRIRTFIVHLPYACLVSGSLYKLFATYCINNQLTFFIDVYTVCVTDAVANYIARLYSHNYIDDCPILVLSEYRNFTTSEKQLANNKKESLVSEYNHILLWFIRAQTLFCLLPPLFAKRAYYFMLVVC